MAAFTVLVDFRVTEDMHPTRLTPGAFYRSGETVNGLSAAEALELLRIAPEGTFGAADEEAQTVATRHIELSGGMKPTGEAEV
jgi:hypothetical protein